ncbi:ABC transporter [Streptomyces sp. NPDC019531]|uniref:ABC transporter n=1 Tax=Streptomyces sp. NPDC019531 TaxID=3365062 RepID=UPI00384C36FC
MTTMTSTRTSSAVTGRGLRLTGLNWLVWRQHRATFWTLIAGTVVAAGWMVYQRMGMMDTLHALGWPHPKSENWYTSVGKGAITMTGYALGFLPILIGVFVGAPLIAGDLENGTAKLVTSQSVSRMRWIITKLGVTVLVVFLGTVVLSQMFGWWWSPMKDRPEFMSWAEGPAFDNTGPVLTALTVFTLVGGIAIGMVLRRTLLSMVVTFGFAVAVQIAWSYFRLQLGNPISLTTHAGVLNSSPPSVPSGAVELDTWFTTASGKLYGWATCAGGATEKAEQACLDKQGIVGWRVDYLPASQMASMQWFGASVLLALTAAVIAFIFVWGRKPVI